MKNYSKNEIWLRDKLTPTLVRAFEKGLCQKVNLSVEEFINYISIPLIDMSLVDRVWMTMTF